MYIRNPTVKRKTPPTKTYKRPAKRARFTGPTVQATRGAITTLSHEIGYLDTAAATAASTTPAIIPLTTMASGDTNLLRDGNKVGIMAVQLRIGGTSQALTNQYKLRFVVVLDKQSNGASPAWLDVFDTATIESQRVVGNLSRFDIVMDKGFILHQQNSTANSFAQFFIKKYLKLPNILACYASGASAVPISNSLTLMYISDIASGAAPCTIAGTARVFFNR